MALDISTRSTRVVDSCVSLAALPAGQGTGVEQWLSGRDMEATQDAFLAAYILVRTGDRSRLPDRILERPGAFGSVKESGVELGFLSYR